MKRNLLAFIAAFFLALAGAAHAQDAPPNQDVQVAPDPQAQPYGDQQSQDAQDDSQAPPENQPGVARVSLVEGDVSTQHGDNGDWVAVTVNTPIAQDDRVSVGEKSRAELELDFADILRMSDRATARITSLSRSQIQIQVGQGLVTYNVARGSEARSEIDTPNASIRPLDGEGEYRILVNSDDETQVIVRRGSAEISTSQGSTRVERGQLITISGTDSPQYRVDRAPGRDDWDDWNISRNRTIRNADSWHKTNPYYTGTEDLDGHGVWSEVPDYGQVWIPRQDPGWAPYRTGRWVYQPYYGWTWVSYEPWGWAPYHYGRWFVYGGNWVWWPGPVAVYPAYYPIWAPAYVSFFGWGGGGWGVGVGFGFGGGFGRVGWLPIGPCDRFHPWWGRGGDRVNVTNIHNTTIINNRYNRGWAPLQNNRVHQFSNLNEAQRDQRVRSGISAMDGNKFGREAVPSHQPVLSEASFKQASMMTGKLPVTPSRESFSPTNKAPGASSVRSASTSSQRFYSPTTSRNSATAATNNTARASGGNSGARTNTALGARSTAPSRQPTFAPSQRSTAGANTVAPSTQHNQANTNPPNAQSPRSGWQHFSPPPSHNVSPTAPTQSARQYQPPSPSSRGSYPGTYGRPPLTMNRPIVQPRGGYPNAPRGGYPSAPRGPYSNGPGGYRGAPPSPAQRSVPRPSAPPSPAQRSVPRSSAAPSYSAPRGNSGGGSQSSGGSSSSHGGGGGSSHTSGGSSSHSGGHPH
jgi:hypothetical protein